MKGGIDLSDKDVIERLIQRIPKIELKPRKELEPELERLKIHEGEHRDIIIGTIKRCTDNNENPRQAFETARIHENK